MIPRLIVSGSLIAILASWFMIPHLNMGPSA